MNIDPHQCAAWRKSWRIAIECGPDRKDTKPRDRVFHYEMTQGGKVSDPRLPKKNTTYSRNKRGGVRLGAAQLTFRRNLRRLITSRDLPVCLLPCRLLVFQCYGGAQLEVGAHKYGRMDASATLEAVCDAIEADKGFRGLVANDVQIVDRRAVAQYVKGSWGLRVELEAMPQWGA